MEFRGCSSISFHKGASMPHLWSLVPAVPGLKILREKNRDRPDIIGPIRSPNQGPGELLPGFHSHGTVTAPSSHTRLLRGAVSSYFQLKQRRDIKGSISKPDTPYRCFPKLSLKQQDSQAPNQLSTMYRYSVTAH